MKPLDKALLCVKIINERKAKNLVLFEIEKLSSIADYFLIASGTSSRQVQAIARHLKRRMKDERVTLFGIEGENDGHWILLDFGDVIVHLFYEPVRESYDLEGLWIEAPRIELRNENSEGKN